jgi:hypothetical protein
MTLRFDWFGGMVPDIPPKEVSWSGVRVLCYGISIALICGAWMCALGIGGLVTFCVHKLYRKGWIN